MTIHIVVTGGRDYRDDAVIHTTLDKLHTLYGIARLAHGANPGKRDTPLGPVIPGLDLRAAAWARSRNIPVVPYEVTKEEWATVGPSAGPQRNYRMLTTEDPHMCVVFPGGRGTQDCERQARRLHIFVQKVRP